ncbi:MAG: aminoglycoside phosphotransferase (APT) family kinase protein [Candidatus Binatia bacterium]|jgi:aminoglycoside phosphotransferase (APT) family kinase protein
MASKEEIKGIDQEPVSTWLLANIEGAQAPFSFAPITGGHSNLTYKVTDSRGRELVLRRPPTGAVLATAHNMAREHRIVKAVGATDVPVPQALGLCEDEAVNGAPFYVMDFVTGVVISDPATVRATLATDASRHKLGESVATVLAKLHAVDPDVIGLGDLGRKEAYLDRQLKRWQTQWDNSKTRELPAMEQTYELLIAAKPEQRYTGIVHGDYRLGNLLARPDSSVAAVLDWELCTLGDTLADLGYTLNDWVEPDGTPALDDVHPTSAGGFQTRAEFVRLYADLTGRDVSGIDYYRAFQYWRLAAIVEGVLARYIKGVMGDPGGDIEDFKKRVDVLADAALVLIRNVAR